MSAFDANVVIKYHFSFQRFGIWREFEGHPLDLSTESFGIDHNHPGYDYRWEGGMQVIHEHKL